MMIDFTLRIKITLKGSLYKGGYDFLLCDREFWAYSQSDFLDYREGAQMVYSHPGHLSQHTEVTFEDMPKFSIAE
ncbi:MAG: hypothetical protein IPK55_10910 [Streptococcus sp.]|nr:hypothetical protein [Streptococcus sp.]